MKLNHVTYGFDSSSKPALVFLNGMTQSTAHWRSHGRHFSDTHRVVTYDARGQGETPVGDEPLSLELHADDLAGLLDELELEKAHLVGFSHGSRIALQFANSHPERVGRLVLVSATATPSALARMIIRSWREVLDAGGVQALTWASLPTILGNDYLAASERMLSGIVKAAIERNSEEGVRALLDAMAEYPDLSDLARGVRAETLVVSATEDPLVTTEGAAELARLCGGTHEVIEGSGHTIPIERPDEFRRLIGQFVT